MPNSGAHYEQAFISCLTRLRATWHRIDQARMAAGADGRVKNFDYIIYPPRRAPLLVDVKGRRFDARSFRQGRLGPNWVTRRDLDGLAAWQGGFPRPAIARFVFAWWIYDLPAPQTFPDHRQAPSPLLYFHRGRFYSFWSVSLDDYRRAMKSRSPRWQTVFIPAADFERIARPFGLD